MTNSANGFSNISGYGLKMLVTGAAVLMLAACSGDEGNGTGLSGAVQMDGSSTVYPISEAVAEEFLSVQPRVRVTVGVSGTGGGFKKFTSGEIDINNASRHISASEIALAEANGIEYLEIPIAFDGLSIVVHPENDWVDYLTVDELHRIWEPGSTVNSWSQVRDGFPDLPIRLYGAGTDSGTFDYFSEAINGRAGASRGDYTASEDDNVLVQGVTGDREALAFFGYAYYIANRDKLKIVPIDGGDGPVAPDATTINNGTYSPLSRPVFIYINKASLARPAVREYVGFYLANAGALANEVGYVNMTDAEYQASIDAVNAVAE